MNLKNKSTTDGTVGDVKIGDSQMSSMDVNDVDLDDIGEAGNPDFEKEMTQTKLEEYIDDIAESVKVGLDQSISILTPWFFNNMPKIYYQTTPRQEKVRHLSAIITGHVFETKQTVELWDREKSKVTYIGPGGERKMMLDMAGRLSGLNLKMGGVYFSRDSLLMLSTFFCSDHQTLDLTNARIKEKVEYTRNLMRKEYPDDGDAVDHYLQHLDNELVMYATPARLSITYRMVKHMLSHEGAHTFLDCFENSPNARLTLGFKNVAPAEILEPILRLVHRYDFNVIRAFVTKMDKGYDESITVMHLVLRHGTGEKISAAFVPMIRLTKALRTLGWVDNDAFSVLAHEPFNFSINAVNLIRGMATWSHIFLSKDNPYAYSQYRVRDTFFKYPDVSEKLVELFRLRFDPMLGDERTARVDAATAELQKKVEGILEDIDRNIFRKSLDFVTRCLKTNYFLPTKTGLAFRFGADVLDKKYYPNEPYGMFFLIGRDFRCFQVRWKDIARGGLRVVMPRNSADYDYALAGVFDEVYGLSFAQQLKNKDIPEGGSKAVLVLRPGGHRDQAVKGAVNALLDLLVGDDESHETTSDKLISYFDKNEIIYLGPDENITNQLITWIPEQAARRGYRYASAFMSSKPGEGINHKEYGVTSEGLNVYVDNTLHFLGIDPKKQPFSIKMTGGPDGDVGGNELNILHREYGENARVVAIADGYGCAFDPKGLAWPELLRLFREGKSIVEFDRSKLTQGTGAYVLAADTHEHMKIRNELAFKVPADIFIPAGGRPYTVNEKNWNMFLDADGKPNMKAVVEGANIFFTAEARKKLQEAGVVQIKDSSANKTGVICSSYEIIASLTLSRDEFYNIKAQYVDEVIEILRTKADHEAKLLLSSFVKGGGEKTLVDLSLEISKEINEITDALLEDLTKRQDKVLKDPFYQGLVIRHCPPCLQEKYRERILQRLPEAHQIAIIASSVASYVVYREGLGWLRTVPRDHWSEALEIYMQKVALSSALINTVKSSTLSEKEQVTAILSRSAARDLTVLELLNRKILS